MASTGVEISAAAAMLLLLPFPTCFWSLVIGGCWLLVESVCGWLDWLLFQLSYLSRLFRARLAPERDRMRSGEIQ